MSIHTISEIGAALTGLGFCFMTLGVIMFFDGALLAMGNVRLSAQALFLCIHIGAGH